MHLSTVNATAFIGLLTLRGKKNVMNYLRRAAHHNALRFTRKIFLISAELSARVAWGSPEKVSWEFKAHMS